MREATTKLLLAGTAIVLCNTAPAWAQDGPAVTEQQPSDAQIANDIVVVGSRIAGAKVTEALPVVILDQAKIDAIAAVSGDELIRSIPQMGDVTFNPGNNAQTSNAARGDVGSINLRSLGVGNTLVLLNGRRVVTHAASQGLSDTGTVPVLSYNSNAIPTTGLARLEVLLDGAAALQIAAFCPHGTTVISLQNGVDNVARITAIAPRMRALAGMVPYNVVMPAPGHVHRATSGNLHIGSSALTHEMALLLNACGLTTRLAKDMRPLQWGKLLINLNNPVNALSDLPLRAQLELPV